MKGINQLKGMPRALESAAYVFSETIFAASERGDDRSRSLQGKKIGHVIVRAQRERFFEDEELFIYPISAQSARVGSELWARQQYVSQFTDRILVPNLGIYAEVVPAAMAIRYRSKNTLNGLREYAHTLKDEGTFMGLTKAANLLDQMTEAIEAEQWSELSDGTMKLEEVELSLGFGDVPDLHLNGYESPDFLLDYAATRARAMRSNMKRQARRKKPSEALAGKIREDMMQVDRARRWVENGPPVLMTTERPTPLFDPDDDPPFRPAS